MFLFQAASRVEVDYEAAEKMQVQKSDFMIALETDIKPVSTLLKYCSISRILTILTAPALFCQRSYFII